MIGLLFGQNLLDVAEQGLWTDKMPFLLWLGRLQGETPIGHGRFSPNTQNKGVMCRLNFCSHTV